MASSGYPAIVQIGETCRWVVDPQTTSKSAVCTYIPRALLSCWPWQPFSYSPPGFAPPATAVPCERHEGVVCARPTVLVSVMDRIWISTRESGAAEAAQAAAVESIPTYLGILLWVQVTLQKSLLICTI